MNPSSSLAQVLALPSQSHHHSHNYYQVVIGLQGQTEFDIQGQGNLVGPGQGCLVPASSEHAFTGLGRNQILVVNLPLNTEQGLQDKVNQLFERKAYFQLTNQSQILIGALCHEILSQPQEQLLGEACAHTLVCVLQNQLAQAKPQRTLRLQMDSIDRYIHQHLHQKISVAQLAGAVYLAESQFYRLFGQQNGITPHQYVLRKRFELAKQLLSEEKLSLQQISDSCGFASQSSFTSAFSAFFGQSPARYKRNNS
ncbi:AraC family transcriptional regulator [Agarivorans sp. TSD2052]|uniref:helix-turn-helix domain-containing protein n=1 Tax=Agarivorans sp. TSD2052 TaxID=2937286 RepID=UPI00200FAB41|nr:AraC family transcriptional regulator [Agarivorans sp. TSD2052]UPW17257.1 AraC family transcriptional regulator [Agarivorans sp. TSD2052]